MLPARARRMKQKATYWPPGEVDGFGRRQAQGPVLIGCRWQGKAEVFIDQSARELTSSAVVYPDRPLAREGFLALGDFTNEIDPGQVSEAKEIRQIGDSPNLRQTKTLHKVWL